MHRLYIVIYKFVFRNMFACCLTNCAALAAFSIRNFIRHGTFPEEEPDQTALFTEFVTDRCDFLGQTCEHEGHSKVETLRYLGKSLCVGSATIRWSLRACSYNSFSEWE